MSGTENGAGPNFDALFAADIETERRNFSIQGHDCWVDLRPMDAGDLARYRTLAMRMAQGGGEDMHSVILYLVERTLRDWELWRTSKAKDSGELVWEKEESRAVLLNRRRQWIEEWKPTPEFWDWLVRECLLINNLLEDQEKNSPSSSGRSRKKPTPA